MIRLIQRRSLRRHTSSDSFVQCNADQLNIVCTWKPFVFWKYMKAPPKIFSYATLICVICSLPFEEVDPNYLLALKQRQRNSSATLRTICVHWWTHQAPMRPGLEQGLMVCHPYPSITLWTLVRRDLTLNSWRVIQKNLPLKNSQSLHRLERQCKDLMFISGCISYGSSDSRERVAVI